jgi:predicted secreted protein with PEFG-CTERM motif
MDIRIFSILTILMIISTGTVFAQQSLISVETDKNNYGEEETILISGSVSTIIGQTPVSLQLFQDGNLIDIAQLELSQDGNYFHTIIAQGPLWKNPGEYIVKVVYGEANVAETNFTYFPASTIVEATDNFEVSAGNSGTFDIKYTIKGGEVENIRINPEILGLIVDINAPSDGTIVLDLPRKFIDAEKQNGKDEEFIILIDNIQTTYEESTTFSEFRTITIDFQPNDSEIQIIGTFVIPEFGTVVMIILTIGIMASILLTKNKFQIKL